MVIFNSYVKLPEGNHQHQAALYAAFYKVLLKFWVALEIGMLSIGELGEFPRFFMRLIVGHPNFDPIQETC